MRSNIGSTVALILGALYLVAGLAQKNAGLVGGPIIILGALAYRSAKYRKSHSSGQWWRIVAEIAAMLVIAFLWLAQSNLKSAIATDPVPNLIIPLWAVVAYGIALVRRPRSAAA